MQLNKDWTLAHFVYYITQLIMVGLVLQFLSVSFPALNSGNNFMSIPNIDPRIAIEASSFGIPTKYYANNQQASVVLSDKLYTNPIFGDEDSDSSAGYIIHLIRLLRFSLLFLFTFYLNRILKSIVDKNPFDPKNPSRIFVMGVSLILFPLSGLLYGYAFSHYLAESVFGSQLKFSPDFLGADTGVFFGLVIIVIAYVFREGSKMYEEQKLTV